MWKYFGHSQGHKHVSKYKTWTPSEVGSRHRIEETENVGSKVYISVDLRLFCITQAMLICESSRYITSAIKVARYVD